MLDSENESVREQLADSDPWMHATTERRWRVAMPKVSSGVGLSLFQENSVSIVVGGFVFSPEMTFIEGVLSTARWESNSIQIGDHILAVNDEWVLGRSPVQVEDQLAGGAPGTTVLLRMMRPTAEGEMEYQAVLKRQSVEKKPSSETRADEQVYRPQTKTLAARQLWMPDVDVAVEAQQRLRAFSPNAISPKARSKATSNPPLPPRVNQSLKPPSSTVPAPESSTFGPGWHDPSTESPPMPDAREPSQLSAASGLGISDLSFGTSPDVQRIRGPPLAQSALPWYVEDAADAAMALSRSETALPRTPERQTIVPKALPTSPATQPLVEPKSASVEEFGCQATVLTGDAASQTEAYREKRVPASPKALPEVLPLAGLTSVVLHAGAGAMGRRSIGRGCWCRKGQRKTAVTKFRTCTLVAMCGPAGEGQAAGELCSALNLFHPKADGTFSKVNIDAKTKVNVRGRRVELVRSSSDGDQSHLWLYDVETEQSMALENCILGRHKYEQALQVRAQRSADEQQAHAMAGAGAGEPRASRRSPAKAELGYLKEKSAQRGFREDTVTANHTHKTPPHQDQTDAQHAPSLEESPSQPRDPPPPSGGGSGGAPPESEGVSERKPIEARAAVPPIEWDVLRTPSPPQLRGLPASRSPSAPWTPPQPSSSLAGGPARHARVVGDAGKGRLPQLRRQDLEAASPRPLDLSGTVTVKVSQRGGRRSEAPSEASLDSAQAGARHPADQTSPPRRQASMWWGPGPAGVGGSFVPEQSPFVPEQPEGGGSGEPSPDPASVTIAQRNAPWRSNLLRRIDPRPPAHLGTSPPPAVQLSVNGKTLPTTEHSPEGLLHAGKIVSPEAMDQAIRKARQDAAVILQGTGDVIPQELVLM